MTLDTKEAPTRPTRHRPVWIYVLSGFVLAIMALMIFWNWDWFIPLVNRQASAALGRTTTIQHLHVKLGRTTTVVASGVDVANAEGFADGKPLVHIDTLTVLADVMAYFHTRQIVIPQIVADHPVIEADQDATGKASWTGLGGTTPPGDAPQDPGAGPRLGQLVINDGHAHVAIAKLKADFNLDIASKTADALPGAEQGKAAANGGEIIIDAKGVYAGQPITGHMVGGALLSLREATNPYPIDLHVANGPTRVALAGTVQNPLNFAGANLKLEFAGPNMGLLLPLTGIPIPETPAYSIAGTLDYADKKIRFTHFTGRLGSSDLNGDISIDPTRDPPFVEADLLSRQVDLADLGGFIGAAPGRKDTPNEAPQTRAEVARAEASPRLLPTTPINLPKVGAADVKLHYKGERILGRSVPLDNMVADLDIAGGRIQVKPVSFAVGEGQIVINADLAPKGTDVQAKADIQFKRLDVGKLLAATGAVQGAGTVSGSADLTSTGNSLATLLGHGDGGLRLGMAGGNLSALLVDIAGLEFGNALLSALGLPTRAQIRCFALDFGLKHGVFETRTLLLDTTEARVVGAGTIDLANESLNYRLKTDSKHFSIGTLPTPIDIGGTLKKPSIAPEAGPLALRGGAAIGLGVLFPPAALIPTIQFGIGEDGACQVAEAPIARQVNAAAGKPPPRRAVVRRRAGVRRHP
jgi:uncharacterized protein involved in outer membrane biogenesis